MGARHSSVIVLQGPGLKADANKIQLFLSSQSSIPIFIFANTKYTDNSAVYFYWIIKGTKVIDIKNGRISTIFCMLFFSNK